MDRWVVCKSCGAAKRRSEFFPSRWDTSRPCSACWDLQVKVAGPPKGRVIVDVTPCLSSPSANRVGALVPQVFAAGQAEA